MDSDLETSLTPEQLIIKSAAAVDMKSQKKLNKKLNKMLNKEKKNTDFMDKVNRNVNQLESILCEIELNTKTLMKITPENSPVATESSNLEELKPKEDNVLPDSQEESKEIKPKEDNVLPDSQEESKEIKPEEIKPEEIKPEEVKTKEDNVLPDSQEESKDDILKQIKNITEKLDDIIDSTNKTITEISNDKNTVNLVKEIKCSRCSNIKWNKVFQLVKDIIAKFNKVKNAKENPEVNINV
jgi:hypothetical protein